MITQMFDPTPALELGIPHSEFSLFYMYQREGKIVYVSITQMGDSLICHIAAERKGKQILRIAIKQLAQYLFMTFPAIKQLISHSYMKSMKNMTRKCGFELMLTVPSRYAHNGEFEILRLARS